MRVLEGPGDRIDGLGGARRRCHPGRHLHVIGNKEVVQMAGNKPVTGRLLHNDVDNVLTIEVARVAEEGLFAIIMIFLEVLEFPVPPVIIAARRGLRDGPAGEGPGGLPDIGLRVVGMPVHTYAQTEQLQKPGWYRRKSCRSTGSASGFNSSSTVAS